MFKEDYQNAYAGIKPDDYLTDRILAQAEEKRRLGKWIKPVLSVAMVCIAVMTVMSLTVMPVLASNIPAVYKMLDSISPALANFFVPIEESCTSSGITMQVEAVYVDGKNAEILLSVRDAEGSDLDRIKGVVDLFDSYGLRSRKGISSIAGSSFVKYDAETGKAYFKVSVGAAEAFDNESLTFYMWELLCDITSERKDISLADMVYEAEMKNVTLSGGSPSQISAILESAVVQPNGKDSMDPRPVCKVMVGKPAEQCDKDGITITGMGYMDGVLRLQICRGTFDHADRHLEPFLVYGNGEEKHQDASLSWQESVNGERLLFEEFYFTVDEKELAECSMYGIFHANAGYVKGDWEVTFKLVE